MAKTVMDFLDQARSIVEKKGQDYDGGKRCKNFFRAAEIARILTGLNIRPTDVIACLIGIKLARYINLTRSVLGEEGVNTPNFESIEDTTIDIMNYFGLLEEVRQMMENPNETSPTGVD